MFTSVSLSTATAACGHVAFAVVFTQSAVEITLADILLSPDRSWTLNVRMSSRAAAEFCDLIDSDLWFLFDNNPLNQTENLQFELYSFWSD